MICPAGLKLDATARASPVSGAELVTHWVRLPDLSYVYEFETPSLPEELVRRESLS